VDEGLKSVLGDLKSHSLTVSEAVIVADVKAAAAAEYSSK